MAARLALDRRNELIANRLSFVTETVFSHPSKLDLVRHAKASGYRFVLYHIGIDSSELATARVATRVDDGGHDVPPEKVAARFERCQEFIPQAADLADITFVFDNSGRSGTSTHSFVMRLHEGRIVKIADGFIPGWARTAYERHLAER